MRAEVDVQRKREYSLLLKIVLARTASVTTRKWALMIALSCVDACMPGQMATCGESLCTNLTDMLFFVGHEKDGRLECGGK
jgi:hypothetical protein